MVLFDSVFTKMDRRNFIYHGFLKMKWYVNFFFQQKKNK